jgi:hypothetical protein
MRPDPTVNTTFGAGRNVTLFDDLRAVAYREVREYKLEGPLNVWFDRCFQIANAINTQFPRPMKCSETRAVAKSVANWTWRHFSAERFIARQSSLGKRGMASRWAGHESVEKLRPWETMGISRATYYRRKRRETDKVRALS